jgi:SAM-dependent methyltransferase
MAGATHWTSHARQWTLIGPPLRPCSADVEFMQARVRSHFADRSGPLPALLLGVTPELASAAWRPELELVAVDRCEDMIAEVWPGDTAFRRALRAEWLELPFAPESFELVLGDGCLTLFDFPRGYERLSASLARVLRPGGRLLLRLFCQPAHAESVDEVFAALGARRIGNFHAFKWRLAMALQGDDSARGVKLADIWDAFRARIPDGRALASAAGLPLAEITTLANYEGVATRYSYSTLEEALGILSSRFELLETWCGSYELGERCPTLVLSRR